MNEPAAWMYPDDLERFETSETFAQAYSIEVVSPTQGETVPLYRHPAREWVGLTDEDVETTFWPWKQFTEYSIPLFEYRVIARAIEAKLRERNEHREKNGGAA